MTTKAFTPTPPPGAANHAAPLSIPDCLHKFRLSAPCAKPDGKSERIIQKASNSCVAFRKEKAETMSRVISGARQKLVCYLKEKAEQRS